MDIVLKQKTDHALSLWKECWGDKLKSAYVYGSVARGDWDKKNSDINLLLILDHNDYKDWPIATEKNKKLVKKGFSTPLLLTENYINSSLDVYPIEFLDMKLFHDTIYGQDLLDGLTISKDHLRLQAEREIKGKWVQLRQAAIERSNDTSAMRELLLMSLNTWVSVLQSILFIEDKEVPSDKKIIIDEGALIAGLNSETLDAILEYRKERKAMNRISSWNLLEKVLEEMDKLARFIDNYQVK